MKLNAKLSSYPSFSGTSTCITNPRAILKRLGINEQKELTCNESRLVTSTETDEDGARGRGGLKTFFSTATVLKSPVSVLKSGPFRNWNVKHQLCGKVPAEMS